MQQEQQEQFKQHQLIFMLKYTYTNNNEGGKTLKIYKENGIIVMNLHESVEGHSELMSFLENESNLDKYANYLNNNPDRAFDLNEIINL